MTLLIFYVQLGTGNIKHMSLISLAVKTINSTVVQISSIFLFEDIQTLIYNLAYLQCVTKYPFKPEGRVFHKSWRTTLVPRLY